MFALKILSFISLIGSIVWFTQDPDFEPALASIAALSASIAFFVAERKQKKRSDFNQSVANGSIGIQAGGNVKTGKISSKAKEK